MYRLVAHGACDILEECMSFEVPLDTASRYYRNLGNIAEGGLRQIGKEDCGGSLSNVGPCFRRRHQKRDASHDTRVRISIKAAACPRLV